MSYFQAEKVLGGLPAQLTKSTLYCVKVGSGFDLYITDDNVSPVAVKLNEFPISAVEGAIDDWFAQSNLDERLNTLENDTNAIGNAQNSLDERLNDLENDTSVIDIARIPAGALERLVTVNDATALYTLTAADVQVGDTVRLADTGVMYRVVDESKLDSAEGYVEYTAGRATAVKWAGVEDKPTTLEGYGILNGVKDTDPRLDDAREWTADTVTAEEAAAGLSDVPRKWTAERVKEAFNAYVRDSLPASETYSYNDQGAVESITTPKGVTQVTYNQDLTVNTVTYPSGRVETFHYTDNVLTGMTAVGG